MGRGLKSYGYEQPKSVTTVSSAVGRVADEERKKVKEELAEEMKVSIRLL